jgi:hypothetical protein
VDGVHPAGKLRGLTELVDEYGEFLAGDLQEYYGVDLRDLFRDDERRLTPLYLLSLVRGLPMESRFNAERRGGQAFRGWDAGRYIDVATVNAVRALQWTYVAAHAKNKPKAPEPFPIPDKTVRRRDKGPGSFAFIAAQKIAAARRSKADGC